MTMAASTTMIGHELEDVGPALDLGPREEGEAARLGAQ